MRSFTLAGPCRAGVFCSHGADAFRVAAWAHTSNIVARAATTLLLLIGELSLGVTAAAGAAAAALSALTITPLFCPRWSRSHLEALSVPLALAGVLVFWVIIPIAGAGKVSGAADDAPLCALSQFLQNRELDPVTVEAAAPVPPPPDAEPEAPPALETEAAPGVASVPFLAW